MKKILAIMLSVMMVMTLVSACGSKTSDTGSADAAPATEAAKEAAASDDAEPAAEEAAAGKKYEGVELKYWTAPMAGDNDLELKLWAEWLSEFEEETGAKVSVEIIPWSDFDTKLMTGVMSNDCADVFYCGGDDTYGLKRAGALVNLEEYFTEEEIADELYWDMMTIEGEHCIAGYAGGLSVRGILYNKTIFEEAGIEKVPETWEEFVAVGQQIKEKCPDVYPYLQSLGGDANAFIYTLASYMYQAGGGIVAADGSGYTFNTAEGLKAANHLKELVDTGILSQDALGIATNREVIDLFAEGKVAMMVESSANYYDELVPDIDWGFAPYTHDVSYGTYNPIDPLAVWSGSANKEAAVDLLRFLRSPDMMSKFRENFWDTAPMLASDPYVPSDEGMEGIYDHPEGCFGLIFAPGYSVVQESAIQNLQLLVMGEATPEEAMAQIQADADKAYEENK